MTREGTERGADCAGVNQREDENRTGEMTEHVSELFSLFLYSGL